MKVIKLFADWCGPCKVVENNLNKAGIEHESISIDSEKGEALAEEYSVRNIPVVLVLGDNGELLHRFPGIFNIDKLKEVL